MMERCPNLKEEVGGSIPGCEISSLLDKNFPGGQLPHVLRHWHVDLLSQKKRQKKTKKEVNAQHNHIKFTEV